MLSIFHQATLSSGTDPRSDRGSDESLVCFVVGIGVRSTGPKDIDLSGFRAGPQRPLRIVRHRPSILICGVVFKGGESVTKGQKCQGGYIYCLRLQLLRPLPVKGSQS